MHLTSRSWQSFWRARRPAARRTEEFTLERDGLEGLPRIAYLADVFCHAPFTEMTLYGETMAAAMPVILHPNELLDGAITNKDYDNSVNADPTYIWQNHPIVLELYRRHGVDLNFVGVVMSNVHHTVEWKQRNAAMAAAMVRCSSKPTLHHHEGRRRTSAGRHGLPRISSRRIRRQDDADPTEFLSPDNDAYGQLLFKSKYADASYRQAVLQWRTCRPSSGRSVDLECPRRTTARRTAP
jgi:glycine reductase